VSVVWYYRFEQRPHGIIIHCEAYPLESRFAVDTVHISSSVWRRPHKLRLGRLRLLRRSYTAYTWGKCCRGSATALRTNREEKKIPVCISTTRPQAKVGTGTGWVRKLGFGCPDTRFKKRIPVAPLMCM